ncbi:MAG: hypothetical protein NXI03_11145 [Alphaproteobacteria bacterium]|uniref:hypothetical protein n=1 Tax=Alexandriicola marinus TaxID=2081710 RepID=UPI000FD8F4EB|nr:hypothetical protein [Alexandriicola marinus]MBM1222906.1 hypothetical protein [Ponticoccus sp. SC6-9]MBM1227288.1 hypothetical protein [Ponticoccus sp. SC6-15]MBM1231832.1 hypothetical protein [Ponticoccus sp. SC6-38]MBM1235499.1 hypothetical protein [Ponticoccus sp. SC6-45]MBM1240855.1 hypothetical protein [Ponticoccus sp. SC6-49]MBM1245390.1 hypothetical protein [Ponticoccus sp. SC2-64]MBM1249959.1 hypothetical protein [Ponticoccus sp. SC6-42]MBM1254348.1 hypothetical protein [Pontico
MTRVTIQDLRASRLCFQGARPWFARHGLDWQVFLREGLEAEVLAATGDALALRVIAIAEAREALAPDAEGKYG